MISRQVRKARKMYNELPAVTFKPPEGDERQRWRITMLGAAKWTLRGNEKIIYPGLHGVNTKFRGDFVMIDKGGYWLLDYNQPTNTWKVRQTRDRVRFVAPGMGIGRFYWSGIFLARFIMVRAT